MTSRERMLIALNNGRPDRLPCQVHNWMGYYLNTYLDGINDFAANAHFGFDFAIYRGPNYLYPTHQPGQWDTQRIDLGTDADGVSRWETHITTPKGMLRESGAGNQFTGWITEHIIKSQSDFELWDSYFPVPSDVDFSGMRAEKALLGDRGILRSFPYSFGQGSPWQSLCMLMGTEESIMMGMDEPAILHQMLAAMVQKTLRVTELWGEYNPADVIETGGGAGSNTVISPTFFREFCLPYDIRQHAAIHAAGAKIVYHLCGGLMHMLDLVVESGADGLETMTPPSMGGDCDLADASRQVGDKLFFVGGFDQNAGFEKGTPAEARRLVIECFEATKDYAGYIICPSDHFFTGDPANLQAFVDAAKECEY